MLAEADLRALDQFWHASPYDDEAKTLVRAMVEQAVEGIDVAPAPRGARGFDPSRITIRWREDVRAAS